MYCIVYVHFVGVVNYYRLKVFENRVIRKVSRLKEKELTEQKTLAKRSVLVTKCYSSDQMKEDKRTGTRDTDGREEKCIQGFGGKVSRKETTWKTRA
jgi:hypothetical protein